MIRKEEIRNKEGSGPSDMEYDGWPRILASNNFGTSSSDLRKAFPNVTKKLCTDLFFSILPRESFVSFLSK